MKIHYPYPVLAFGGDDYNENCSFEIGVEIVEENEKSLTLLLSYSLECPGLAKLIEEERAFCGVTLKCPQTAYQKSAVFDKDKMQTRVSVPLGLLSGRVSITGKIVAKEDIQQFSDPEGFNDAYFHGMAFDIKRGAVLAIDEGLSIYIDTSEPGKMVSSIFTICLDRSLECGKKISFDGEKIEISLSADTYNSYYQMRGFGNDELLSVLNAVIVLPELVCAVEKVRTCLEAEDDSYENRMWFQCIRDKADELGIELTEGEFTDSEIADRMLGGIMDNAVVSVKAMITAGNTEQEDDE